MEAIAAMRGIDRFDHFRVCIADRVGGPPVLEVNIALPVHVPYEIASGAVDMNPALFGLASVASRGLRFFIVAGLLWYFGPPIRAFVERYLGWVVSAFCVLLIGGFVVLRFVF